MQVPDAAAGLLGLGLGHGIISLGHRLQALVDPADIEPQQLAVLLPHGILQPAQDVLSVLVEAGSAAVQNPHNAVIVQGHGGVGDAAGHKLGQLVPQHNIGESLLGQLMGFAGHLPGQHHPELRVGEEDAHLLKQFSVGFIVAHVIFEQLEQNALLNAGDFLPQGFLHLFHGVLHICHRLFNQPEFVEAGPFGALQNHRAAAQLGQKVLHRAVVAPGEVIDDAGAHHQH